MSEPRILLATPCGSTMPAVVHQAIAQVVKDRTLDIEPWTPENTVIHLARDQAIRIVRDNESFSALCFCDADQVFDPRTIRRLWDWNVEAVAPVIVQRVSDPLPVARILENGTYRHATEEILGYWAKFPSKSLTSSPTPILWKSPKNREALCEVSMVGTGMFLLRRTGLMKIKPDSDTGLFCDFLRQQGEDFSLCDKLRAAGVPIFLDRGCAVGHLTNYIRSAVDLMEWADGWDNHVHQA